MTATATEDVLRPLAPQVLGALVRRYGHFDLAEDAVQEALLAAVKQWQDSGLPSDPRRWLIAVASRRLTDLLRAEQARRRREEKVSRWTLPADRAAPGADHSPADADDTLTLLVLCCDPSLPSASQIALTLRAVGGLTTREVARAFLVPEATMTRRISRAKRQLRNDGVRFELPPQPAEQLGAVLHVLYLIFNEGYASTAGPDLTRPDLCREAIRLTRSVHRSFPDDGEVAGLLALMLLIDARRDARTGPGGELIPMDEQDRTRWDATSIEEGVSLVSRALRERRPGPYQLQAAISAVHDEAPSADATDWREILALYDLLIQATDSPVVSLNRAVAAAMVHGPRHGLDLLTDLESDQRLAGDHRLHSARAHLLEMTGDRQAARAAYAEAARHTMSTAQQRYLHLRAGRLE